MDGNIPALPGPILGERPQHDDRNGRRRRHTDDAAQRQNGIPSRDQILQAMAQLAGLVIVGVIAPGRASVIHRIFESLLRQQSTATHPDHAADMDVDELRRMFRNHPQMADHFAPFLGPGVLDSLLRGEDPTP